MLVWHATAGMVVLGLMLIAFFLFLRRYRTQLIDFFPLFLVLCLFAFGFGLRLSGKQAFIDFGYFLTDISYLFTYLLFTAALILGQKKYWKIP